MNDSALAKLSLTDAANLIAKKKISSRELVENNLKLLEKHAPELNCLVRTFSETALADADAADQQLALGKSNGPLHGVPLAHKDMFYRQGKITTCGSKICENFIPEVTSSALIQLDHAGAIDLGRLQMVEFAYGLTGHNEITGNVLNPWNRKYITGGSSSGPAAAVSSYLCYGSLGSDTGGSIRFPASCCGLVGMKPTYGRVSRFGAMPLSFTLDHIGPITRTVSDNALLTQSIAGFDAKDHTSANLPVGDYFSNLEKGIKDLKIGVPTSYFTEVIHDEIHREMQKSLKILQSEGAQLIPIAMPASFEISNSMANLIGSTESTSAHRNWLMEKPELYGSQTRERLMAGLGISALDYLDALKLREVVLKDFLNEVFSVVDVLHAPVLPFPVPTLLESDIQANPGFIDFLALLGHCTRPFDYLGLPALSIPAGFTDNGLPTGFQLVAPPFHEALLYQTAFAYEKANPWNYPDLF